MKLIDGLKDFFFASDEEEETTEVITPEPEPEPEPVFVPTDSKSERAAATAEAYNSSLQQQQQQNPVNIPPALPEYEEPVKQEPKRKNNTVVNIQTTAQLQVVLVKPSVFSDAKQIADHLIAKKTVVLNLETASPENKRRIIDFLVGVTYANGGSLKPVANLTYIITPYNVGFIGEDLVGELENNGVFI